MNLVLIYFALKYKGNFDKIFKALKNNEYVSQEDLDDVKLKLTTDKLQAMTILDDKYPEAFKELDKPPFVLFYRGDLDLLGDDVRKMVFTGEKLDKHSEKYLSDMLNKNSIGFVPIVNSNSEFETETIKRFAQKQWPVIVFNPEQMNTYLTETKNDKLLVISQYPPMTLNTTKRISETNKIVTVLSEKLWIFSSNDDDYVGGVVKEFKKLKKVIFCFQDGKGDLGNKRFLNKKSNLIEEITFNKIGEE